MTDSVTGREGRSDGFSPFVSWLLIREWLLFSLLVVLTLHIYSNSRNGPFVFDDLHNIVKNPKIQISQFDWSSLRQAAFQSPIQTRPVAYLSFALNYYFYKLDPESFRLVNVLIHLTNGFLLLLFLKLSLRTPVLQGDIKSNDWSMPFAASFIWIVNPVHTQSVSYIVQRMNSMAALFCLLAFVFYIYARLSQNKRHRNLLMGSSFLAFLMALGSKENSITMPFFIFLYEWYFFRDLDFEWLKKESYWLLIILLFWVGMVFFYLNFHPSITTDIPVPEIADLTILQRLMTQSRVVIFYIFLFIFPHPSRLNLDHNFSISMSPFDPPTTLLAMLVILAALAVAVIIARRERFLSFCILWFLGNLVIESSVGGLEMVYEHRTYIPTLMISMVLVMVLYRTVANVWARRAVLLLFVAFGAIWTHERNAVWADNIALWEDSVKKSPVKVRPYVNLGIAYSERGQFEKGIEYLQLALHLKPDYVKPRFNLALSLLNRGDFQRGDYQEAELQARAFLGKNPKDVEAINILAMALANQNKFEESLDYFYKALLLEPDDEYVHFHISQIMVYIGQFQKAAMHCSEALKINPDYKEARMQLAQIRRMLKQRDPKVNRPFSENPTVLR